VHCFRLSLTISEGQMCVCCEPATVNLDLEEGVSGVAGYL